MTSSITVTLQGNEANDEKPIEVKESRAVTTIQRIYREDNDNIILRDSSNRRSCINRSAYAKLHRSLSAGTKRHSVDNLKGRFENLVRQSSEPKEQSQSEEKNQTTATDKPAVKPEILPKPVIVKRKEPKKPIEKESSEEETKFTPASFGYPKTAKLAPPLIKPKPAIRKSVPKDENSNLVKKNSESSDAEEISIILRQSASEESIDKIAKELSSFTMDGKPKERKRANSFKKLFMGGLFGKDKKKKEEDKNKLKYGDSMVYNDNIRNESNFNRQSPQRQTVPVPDHHTPVNTYNDQILKEQEVHEEKVKELEQKYAELHVNRFNQIRHSFGEDKVQDYLPMDNAVKKPSISDYISAPVNRYIDTSSSASTESEKPNGVVARDTPPRAQETYQNFKLVKPKASIPISSERSLPNPYQNEKTSPRTIERNLNKSNGKDYPDKANFSPNRDDTYGTVFDSLEYAASRNGEIKPINLRPPLQSPKSPSLESTKLKLPPNREIYDLQPRVKSPIPTNKVSTEKIIATELLKNTRSPTPPKRTVSKPAEKGEEVITVKPPVSPKLLPKKPSPVSQNQPDKIVTNALVHAPRRAQTPLENRTYSNVLNFRASTPVDLRMSAALKLSPQKPDIRRSVEEYYWKELKKLKEEEDSKLYNAMNDYYDDSARVRRSRSLSPSSHKTGRRSSSLPRDGRVLNYVDYSRVPPQQPIPEERTLILNGQVNRQLVYDQNFARNNPERRSVDSLQRPIFRRGSLTKQEIYDTQPYNKRVSFSNSQALQQVWPTRNGFTQSPPQRRLEKMNNELEDEVFIQNPPPEPIYGTRYNVQNEPVYSNRILEQFRAQQAYDMRRQQMNYGQPPPQIGPRRLSMDSIPRSQQDIYVTRSQFVRRPVPNVPPREVMNDYGRNPNFQQYPSNSQLSLQRNPVYSSRQSITDSNYGQKHVSVRNRFCDFYGQIHDSPQTGVVMGRLQDPKMVPRQPYTQPPQPENFVRGSRLTASANDIGKRYADSRYGFETNDKISINYENRPLPPPPPSKKSVRHPQISDTESGSDASEIQRIMQNKSKSKKRGLFGK
ncbi:hypothetical protein BDFB_005463 [Asbolus verrucosus]|uniref:Uncharacterized protein n=1 Tax=Asbolus verrucosus TaxID=1661398 RepID=A0A482VLN5_ASBVE|nr:hypothetical protein BDFB_005463 [Asbolus verrucosus]